MENNIIIIKKSTKKEPQGETQIIRIKTEVYKELVKVSELSNNKIIDVASNLLKFALEHSKIEE